MKKDNDLLLQRKDNSVDPLEIIKDLIKIKSYQEGEMEENVVEYIENRLKKFQIDYDILNNNGNKIGIVASVGQGDHSLILHSHLDTVPPGDIGEWTHDPFDPYCSSTRLYGRGACDDKGSLAAMLSTFEELILMAPYFNGKLILMAVGGEERGGIGTQIAMKKGYKAEAAVLGEPTSLEPKIAHKGVLRIEITIKGKAAHASTPKEGKNAILYMSRLIPELEKLALLVEKEFDPYTGHASMAITTIKGGTALNMIPDTCSISIDRRIIPGQKEESIMKQIELILDKYQSENPEVYVGMKRIRCTRPAITEPSEPISEIALKIASKELQRKIEPAGFPACCDMTFLRNEGNMPVVILGPGDVGVAHKINEYVDIESLYKAHQIYKNIAMEWLLSRKA